MKREGYLIVDHSASPGLPEDVARRAGYDPKHCGEGQVFEAATLTCSHCKIVSVKNPLRTRERSYCAKCGGHYICDLCAIEAQSPTYAHLPFAKLADITLNLAEKGMGSPRELLESPIKIFIP
jgi:hypothetical protein